MRAIKFANYERHLSETRKAAKLFMVSDVVAKLLRIYFHYAPSLPKSVKKFCCRKVSKIQNYFLTLYKNTGRYTGHGYFACCCRRLIVYRPHPLLPIRGEVKMEATRSSEMLFCHVTTRCHKPKDHDMTICC
jgi:hypothetical protein